MVRACIIIREAIMKSFIGITTTAALLAAASAPAMAKEEAVALTKCDSSHGTIAIVDGDTQGWSEYGLGSPRELINSLAIDSGCFTPHSAASRSEEHTSELQSLMRISYAAF